VRLEASPDPVRVRAAFVSDDDIREMADAWTGEQLPNVPTLPAGEAA
jgi:DNA segregation ATPase FtsK/SpoIIIE, S-DNA-T family